MAVLSINCVSAEMKYTLPYLLDLFLLAVWLFSRCIAIEEISLNPEFPDRPWVSEDVHRQELSTISLTKLIKADFAKNV